MSEDNEKELEEDVIEITSLIIKKFYLKTDEYCIDLIDSISEELELLIERDYAK